jgi:hypothetical protein
MLPDEAELGIERRDDLFDGVSVIKGRAVSLYEASPKRRDVELTAIPYYAWAYRGKGEMKVWLPRQEEGVRPLPKPTIASEAKASASGGEFLDGLSDRWEPASSGDQSRPYLHWGPRKGTTEWVQYDLAEAVEVSRVGVYWFDDTGRGETRVPASWRVLFQRGGRWVPVESTEPYDVAKDAYNWVSFQPIRTSALRLEIQSQEEFSIGILEWEVQ